VGEATATGVVVVGTSKVRKMLSKVTEGAGVDPTALLHATDRISEVYPPGGTTAVWSTTRFVVLVLPRLDQSRLVYVEPAMATLQVWSKPGHEG
jgi:hypothetical protein